MARFPSGRFSGLRNSGIDYSAQAGSPAVAAFFNAVYGWMAAGLGVTAVVAWYVSSRPDLLSQVYHSGMLIFLIIAELALVFIVSRAINALSATAATALFLLYAALNGLTLSIIFLAYAQATIASAFIACAASFGVMSVYGMVTRTDLTRFGPLLFMALVGLVIALVVNAFLHNPAMEYAISCIGVVLFVGLTAYDTQRLKQVAYSTAGDSAMASRLSVSGALMLYLDFLNLFLFILEMMGNRQRR